MKLPTVVMVSCEQRVEVRAQTLRQFHSLGHHPKVILDPCHDPTPAAVLRNAYNAVAPHDGDARGVLFVEDDIDLNAGTFDRFVRMAMESKTITTLCLLRHSLYPAWVAEDTTELPGCLVKLRDYDARRGFHGTMCVYLPPAVVSRIRGSPSEFMDDLGNPIPDAHGFDFWLKTHATEYGGMLAAIPNPVNHRPGVSMWGNKPDVIQDFQSTTYRMGVSCWR